MRLQYVFVAALMLGTVGCGGYKDFAPEEFNAITKDMPEEQVRERLGKPNEVIEALSVRRLFWESQGKYYSISFGEGKVIAPLAHADQRDYLLMKEIMRAGKKLEK
jgi:hypothetical protein